MKSEIHRAAAALKEADALLITAGAGMGVDSGLPDFRGTAGFWAAYPAVARLGLRFEQMANPAWFTKTPALAWAFYGHRLNLYRQTAPHRGFGRLLGLGHEKPLGSFVFTSNVDGHFQKAGFDSSRIVECHGSIQHFQCARPCSSTLWDAPPGPIEINEETFEALPPLPACPHCGCVARPNILMFGDGQWIEDCSRRQEKLFRNWLAELARHSAKLAIVELGAGEAVPTVRMTSESIAARFNGTLIRINPRDSHVPSSHYGLALGALEGLDHLFASL